jgi:hypothetical protein
MLGPRTHQMSSQNRPATEVALHPEGEREQHSGMPSNMR